MKIAKTFDVLHFVADNAGLSTFEAIEKAYNIGMSEQETKWIPVSERLPSRDEYIKNNGLFIVSDGNRSYSEWYDIYDTRRFGEPTMIGFRIDYVVIAWMPLPKPYKAESEDKE